MDTSNFHIFTTNSQALMQGLLFLINNTTKQDYNLFTREDKPSIISSNFCQKGKKKKLRFKAYKINVVDADGNSIPYHEEGKRFDVAYLSFVPAKFIVTTQRALNEFGITIKKAGSCFNTPNFSH